MPTSTFEASVRGWCVLVCAISALVSVCRGGELLQSHWHCDGFPCQFISDGSSSGVSLRVSNRTAHSHGPRQTFNITANSMYSVRAYVSIVNDVAGRLGQTVDIVINYRRSSNRNIWVTVARHPMARTQDGWILMQGNFKAHRQAIGQAQMRIAVANRDVDFDVRGASVTNIWYGNGWRPHADNIIRQVRQSDILLNITTAGNVNKSEVEIQVVQRAKAFPIGTVVNSWTYEKQSNWRYRDFVHDHFNWAVLEAALKWKHVEPAQGHNNFALPVRVLRTLRENGLKIRGHNLLWPIENMVPGWVRKLRGEELRSEISHHINTTMTKTRGLVEHWDVLNENLHGQWFQQRLQDFSWEQTPFLQAQSKDPNVTLFLNDFDIVAHGKLTGAYIEQAKRLQQANVGVGGLGVQCHFWTEEMPDPYLIKDRLDKLSQTGLPIWVTEFNVVSANERRRADMVETAMRAFYGHPAVKGILLWGFWDKSHSRGPHAALVKGDTLQLTAAGQRFLDLWERQWMTNVTHVLSDKESPVTVRGFHGDYQVHVRYQGRELSDLQRNMTLGENAQTVNIHIQV